MIQGEVLKELIPNRRYKVRIMNNKPLKDDIRKTLEEEAAKVQDALDKIQKKYDDYNGDNKILALEIDIERLEQHEEQTLSVLNKINKLERQIYNITVIKSEIERSFRSVAQELRNVQVQLIRLNNEPDYFDFDMWCSNYRKWNVGDTVPVVSNGYDVKDWIILPDWEFNIDSAGFGNALTSKYLLETYEWVYSQIKLNENVNKDVTKYGKAKIIYREGDKVSVQVEWARIWDMGTVSRQRIQEVYTNCNTIYTEGAYIPYFIGAEVLVRFNSDWEADVIGFWQEPVKPFSISSPFAYDKSLFIENLQDRDDKGLDPNEDFGFVNGAFRNLTEYSTITLQHHANNDTFRLFNGLTVTQSGYVNNPFYRYVNKYNRPYSSTVFPNSQTDQNGVLGDTNALNSGVIAGENIIMKRSGPGFAYPFIVFFTKQIAWNNAIIDIDDKMMVTLRNGFAYTPPTQKVQIWREDGSREIKDFSDFEIQFYFDKFIRDRQDILDANPQVVLYNPRTNTTHNNYRDFIEDCLESSGFYSQSIVDQNYSEQKIYLGNLLKDAILDDTANSQYASSNETSKNPPLLYTYDNTVAFDIFNKFIKPRHAEVQDDVILKTGQAFNQFEDWYVRNVNKTDTFTDSPFYNLSDYEKSLYFEYYKISYIE